MRKIKKRAIQIILYFKYLLCVVVSWIYHNKYKNVWLISERGDEARDNGYIFYKYLKKKHPEINVKYVISKTSQDISKIKADDVIFYRSFKHMMYFINSKYLISTHIMGYSPEFGLFSKLDNKHLVWVKGKRIFIQHGIIYNFVPNLEKVKLDMFVTSTDDEQKYIVSRYGYNESQVKCTGLARYDELLGQAEHFILAMPTWRSYLYYSNENEFQKSDYFKNWNSFLNSDKLSAILKKYHLTLYFYPHPESQRHCDVFKSNISEVVIADSQNYDLQYLLRKCAIFITDYSSASFDAAYLRRPIIYYQFDYSKFYKEHYEEGYLNLRNNGLGESASDLEQLIKILENICKNNCLVNKKIETRINNFFKYHDQNNCERIYQEIIKL